MQNARDLVNIFQLVLAYANWAAASVCKATSTESQIDLLTASKSNAMDINQNSFFLERLQSLFTVFLITGRIFQLYFGY